MSNERFKLTEQRPQAPQAVNIVVCEIAGFVFNANALMALDRTQYDPEKEDRKITLLLAHGIQMDFNGPAADQAEHWYLTLTGQARVNPV